uniref:Uncharacterized protein n=1 Tax=Micrurus surinamensis TaxID=129470 RepID=A0A2D4PKY6_MICSU
MYFLGLKCLAISFGSLKQLRYLYIMTFFSLRAAASAFIPMIQLKYKILVQHYCRKMLPVMKTCCIALILECSLLQGVNQLYFPPEFSSSLFLFSILFQPIFSSVPADYPP